MIGNQHFQNVCQIQNVSFVYLCVRVQTVSYVVCEPIVKHVGISWYLCFVSVQNLVSCQFVERMQKWQHSVVLALQLLCLAFASISCKTGNHLRGRMIVTAVVF